MREVLKKIIPGFIIRYYKAIKKKKSAANREKLKSNANSVTQSDIENKLIELGLIKGDVVMLHSSLSKIGYVEGGAKSVIKSFMKVIGDNGTLVMPTFPAQGYNYDYLSTNPLFEVRNTPSKTGIISEIFRESTGVKRSVHPTEPVAALGSQAEYLTSEHYNQITPYNSFSPFYKLSKLKGKIVLLGVDLNSLTNLHTLEDAVSDFKFPVYHSKTFECEVVNEKGERSRVKTKVHDPKWSKQRKCNAFIPLFKTAGFMKEGILSSATVYIIEADKMHEWMVKNYIEKGITMYTPQGS